MGISLRALLGFEGELSQFCIFIFVSPPQPSCRFQVVISKLLLPSCRFYVVASKLMLPCFRFHVVAFMCLRLTSCWTCTYLTTLSKENVYKKGKNTQKYTTQPLIGIYNDNSVFHFNLDANFFAS